MMLVADQPLLPTNMTAVAREFGFSDAERDETTLVCLCMLVGSSGTFANSQVRGFPALLCCRGAVGAGMGGLIPASFALIGDMYPPGERPQAISMVSIISGLGLSVGQALAGFVGTAFGWRAPFALVGIMGWGVTALLVRIHVEPRSQHQGDSQPALLEQPSSRPSSRQALLKPTVLCICLQGITGCVPWAVIGTFMADYLATNCHMGVPGATAVLFSFGVGCTTGTVTGGKLGNHLYKKDKSLQGWLMGATVWGGMLPMFCLFAPWHDGMKQVPGMLKAGDWFVSRSFPGLGLPRFSSGSTGFQKKAVQKQDLQ
ncbi:sotB [Symbiodinium pilosum]|uniref:SotB protein n=1 Tax=Symbiodinium pilosum TaxID=2952 RepID=A0A812S6U7_SYMPI|nr:sotB [Symbiodinium pilosum]